MAFSHGSKAKLYVGGRDLTGFLTSVGAPADRDMGETSVLGNVDKTFIPGLIGGTFAVEGLYDGAAAAIDELLEAALADVSGKVVSYLPAGDAFASRGRFMTAHEGSYEVTTPVDGVAAISAEFTGTAGPDGGLVLHPLGAQTVTGNGTTQDDGAASSNGGVGYLQVTAYSGLTDAVIAIQHSVNGSAWADLITFATVTGANVSERKTVSGTVDRYLRYTRTLTGAGSITFHVGFARK